MVFAILEVCIQQCKMSPARFATTIKEDEDE
jgi:hypothetical protein